MLKVPSNLEGEIPKWYFVKSNSIIQNFFRGEYNNQQEKLRSKNVLTSGFGTDCTTQTIWTVSPGIVFTESDSTVITGLTIR